MPTVRVLGILIDAGSGVLPTRGRILLPILQNGEDNSTVALSRLSKPTEATNMSVRFAEWLVQMCGNKVKARACISMQVANVNYSGGGASLSAEKAHRSESKAIPSDCSRSGPNPVVVAWGTLFVRPRSRNNEARASALCGAQKEGLPVRDSSFRGVRVAQLHNAGNMTGGTLFEARLPGRDDVLLGSFHSEFFAAKVWMTLNTFPLLDTADIYFVSILRPAPGCRYGSDGDPSARR